MLAGPAPSRVPARRGARRLCCGGGRPPPAPQRPFCAQMVDAGGGPAGEGWRRMEAAPDGAADIVPLDRYDSARAKIAANLQWICAKAYGIGGSGRGRGGGPGAGGGGGAGAAFVRGVPGRTAPRGGLSGAGGPRAGARDGGGAGGGRPAGAAGGGASPAAARWRRGVGAGPAVLPGVGAGQTLDALRRRGAQRLARGTARRETGVEWSASREPRPRGGLRL